MVVRPGLLEREKTTFAHAVSCSCVIPGYSVERFPQPVLAGKILVVHEKERFQNMPPSARSVIDSQT
jgi:hypothetical protein